jgi:predicted amidophosphoribosyltransferase
MILADSLLRNATAMADCLLGQLTRPRSAVSQRRWSTGLKNRSDRKALAPIAEAAVEFINGSAPTVDAIVPVPPSRKRAYRPVVEIAKAIATSLSVPVDLAAIVKAKDTPELKNVFDFKERTSTLKGAFKVNEKAVRGKRILLVDDL